MKSRATLVGCVGVGRLAAGGLARLAYPPFDVLVTLVEGEPFAIEDACNHAGASLSEGRRCGATIACPMHGYVFDLRTGRLVQPLGFCQDQRRFDAWLDGDQVCVADPGPIATVLAP